MHFMLMEFRYIASLTLPYYEKCLHFTRKFYNFFVYQPVIVGTYYIMGKRN